jgi:hypothetical protein
MTAALQVKRAAALAQMKLILADFMPSFEKVYVGEPLGLPASVDRAVAVWYSGEEEKFTTIGGNVLVWERWTLRCYWKPRMTEADREALELAVWDAARDVQEAFRADSDLGGNVTDLHISLAEGDGWIDVGESRYRVLDFVLLLAEFEAEAISA